MKKCLLIVLIILLFCGCNKNENRTTSTEGINGFNGIYKNSKNVFYVIATDKDKLEYCVLDEYENRNYGTLEYRDGVAINDDFEEVIKLTIHNGNLKVEMENTTSNFSGVYTWIKDFTLDDYYEYSYGKTRLINSSYSGKFVNDEGVIYIYQPTDNYVEIQSTIKDDIVECEVNLKDNKGLYCDFLGTLYTYNLEDNKLTFKMESSEEENYEGTFTKNSDITKQEVINVFDPFGMYDELEND